MIRRDSDRSTATSRRVEAHGLAPDLEEGVLDDFLSQRRPPHDALHQAEDPREGGVVQRRQCAFVVVDDGVDPGGQLSVASVRRHICARCCASSRVIVECVELVVEVGVGVVQG